MSGVMDVLPLVLFCVALAGLFFMAGVGWATRNKRGWEVTVGQSRDGSRPVQHMMSAQLRHGGEVIHYERVDLREDGWEEKMAENIAAMKQKGRALEAARKIGAEL